MITLGAIVALVLSGYVVLLIDHRREERRQRDLNRKWYEHERSQSR